MDQKLISPFVFMERNRSRLTFSDASKIRLNPKTNRVELKRQSIDPVTHTAVYPLDTDLTVTTWEVNPTAVRQWLSFAADPKPTDQPTGTSVGYKINDGTDDRYWDGGAWEVAGAADWNTEDEVSANLGTFPMTKKLKVVLNLVTTDVGETPSVGSLDVLMLCRIDYIRTLIGDSLVASLRSSIQPTFDFGLDAPGGTLVSLRGMETPYEILSVDEVYNHTQDPDHLTDLYSAYDATSKTITLTAAQDRGDALWVRFTAQPDVYVSWPSQDYTEVARVPAVIINVVDLTGGLIAARQEAHDRQALQATVRKFPFRLTLEFEVSLLAKDNRTLMVMMDHAMQWEHANQLLRWEALDQDVCLLPVREGSFTPRPTLSDEHEASFSFKLEEVYLWLDTPEVLPLIQSLNLNMENRELGIP